MNNTAKQIKVCLAGNPNCGKSTVFNNLTGLRQHIGNYPGVTVEKKEGFATKYGYTIKVIDLPGIYSLSANSEDEIIARNVLIEDKPDLIINVIDSSNLERNLYLYAQLSELGIPVIIAMNMTDMLNAKGNKIDYDKLLKKYNITAIPITANKNIGTDTLIKTIISIFNTQNKKQNIFVDYGHEITKQISDIISLINKDSYLSVKYPVNYLAAGLIKQDLYVLEIIKNSKQYQQIYGTAKKINKNIIEIFKESIEVIFADKIYGYIEKVCNDIITKTSNPKSDISDGIDKIVLNKFFAIPVFALIMYIIFKFTFTVSEPFVGLFETAIENLSSFTLNLIPEGIFQSFMVDGIISGVGAVLGFFPLVLLMFFAIAFFEDTGYMARAVFIMDKFMRKFGLHGKSFASMIIATNGCAIPAMMASRTIDNKKDRLITLLVTPFMICGAKLPIFALFIGAFFTAKQGADVMFVMYAISVMLALGAAWVLKQTILKGEPGHFIMELPPYRRPSLKNIALKMWERGWSYIKKTGTIILFASVLMWAGLSFPETPADKYKNSSDEEIASVKMQNSYIGRLGQFIEPVIKPIGFDGKLGVALIAGLAAKEVVVSTLATIYALGDVAVEDAAPLSEKISQDPDWNVLKAVTFLVFCLIYLPCLAAVAVFYRETGSKIKWVLFLLFWTTLLGWILSFIVYNAGKFLGLGG